MQFVLQKKNSSLKREPEARDSNDRRRGRDRPETVSSLKKKLARLENDFEMGKFTGKNEKKFFDQARIISRKIKDMQSTDSDSEEAKVASEELRAAMEEQEGPTKKLQKRLMLPKKLTVNVSGIKKLIGKEKKQREAHRELRKSKKKPTRLTTFTSYPKVPAFYTGHAESNERCSIWRNSKHIFKS